MEKSESQPVKKPAKALHGPERFLPLPDVYAGDRADESPLWSPGRDERPKASSNVGKNRTSDRKNDTASRKINRKEKNR